MKNLLYILFMIVFVSAKIYSQELNDKAQQSNNLEKIRKSISEKNANWKAEENWITRLTSVEQNKLFGNVIDLSNINSPTLINLPKVKDLPIKFDWRNNNGNWISPVKNQGLCGSCWAFSAVAQIEAWWKIYKNSPDSVIDLSEQFLLSCSNAGSCNGGSITDALEFIKDVGIPQENCFPYSANDLISCSNVCINWKNEVVKIPGWNWITNGEALIDNIKNAVFIHPVSAFLEVYTDLKYYSSGIYQHVLGEYETGHWI
ncbi:MAG: C1 family peptidase, partial [Ignavibacteriaceae bacterium]